MGWGRGRGRRRERGGMGKWISGRSGVTITILVYATTGKALSDFVQGKQP
jgi:hypothetical protein